MTKVANYHLDGRPHKQPEYPVYPNKESHLMWLGNEQTTNIKSSEPSWRNSQDAKTSFTAVAMVATAARSTTMKVPTDVPEERWQW